MIQDLPTPEGTITKETFPKAKPHPLLSALPAHLKDPANYDKIRLTILEAGSTKHSHGEMVDWAGCKVCQAKQVNRLQTMRKLGFKNAAQYMAWQKVHETIKRRDPYSKYNS